MNVDFLQNIIFRVAFTCMNVYLLKSIDNVIREFDKWKGDASNAFDFAFETAPLLLL